MKNKNDLIRAAHTLFRFAKIFGCEMHTKFLINFDKDRGTELSKKPFFRIL